MAKSIPLKYSAESDAAFIGIVTDLPHYRLAHFINKHLSFNLRNIDEIPFFGSVEDIKPSFHFFYWEDIDNRIIFSLLGNKKEGVSLLRSVKQIDYILVLNGPYDRYDLEGTVKKIRDLRGIRLAQQLETKTNSELEVLNQLIEIHLLEVLQK